MVAMNLHDVLVQLLTISDLIRAECALLHIISQRYKVCEHTARWFAIRIVLAEDVSQYVQGGGTATILYVTQRWRWGC